MQVLGAVAAGSCALMHYRLAPQTDEACFDSAALHLPLEGEVDMLEANQVGVTAALHMLRGCHPTPDCLRQSDPPPPGEGEEMLALAPFSILKNFTHLHHVSRLKLAGAHSGRI
jgi:hypothetical protein